MLRREEEGYDIPSRSFEFLLLLISGETTTMGDQSQDYEYHEDYERFEDYVSHEDWLGGVALFEALKVSELTFYRDLASSFVGSGSSRYEVRAKLRLGGVQWLECSCSQNRRHHACCQHILAFLLDLKERKEERVSWELALNLLPKRKREKRLDSPYDHKVEDKSFFPENLSSLKKIYPPLQGENFRLEFMRPSGETFFKEASVDQAASIILGSSLLPHHLSEWKVQSKVLSGGFFLSSYGKNSIQASKVVRVFEKSSLSFSSKIQSEEETQAFFYPYNEATASFWGQKYVFLPEQGFYPYLQPSIKMKGWNWTEEPYSLTFVDEEAGYFLQNIAPQLEEIAPVFWESELWKVKDVLPLEISLDGLIWDQGKFLLPFHSSSPQEDFPLNKGSIYLGEVLSSLGGKTKNFLKIQDQWFSIPQGLQAPKKSSEGWIFDPLEVLKLKATLGKFENFSTPYEVLQKLGTMTEPSVAQFPEDWEKIFSDFQLRDYQVRGVEWLWYLYSYGLHGLLADDMGLGKTHQSMVLMMLLKRHLEILGKPWSFLVIAPTTVLDHWMEKIWKYAPSLNPMKFHGTARHNLWSEFGEKNCGTLVTSYGVLIRDRDLFQNNFWSCLILDEAHLIKNRKTSAHKASCDLQSQMKVCLSGTPMENHLKEIKNLFDFLLPGYLGSDAYFQKYLAPQNEASELLLRLLAPFKLRRTKSQVLKELPEKIEDFRYVSLSNFQDQLYRSTLEKKAQFFLNSLTSDGDPIPYLHIFALLQQLKQICNHPSLIQKHLPWDEYRSGKFELLKELLQEAIESEQKVVVFSQYVGMIEIISSYCKKEKIGHSVLTGKTTHRGELIKNFQENPDQKVMIASLLAGGLGIDLTAASVVIHYDRWWNATKEQQATDRIHRIGQNRSVHVIKIITRGTIEEKIHNIIKEKEILFQNLLSQRDESFLHHLSREELITLFKP